MKPIVRQKLFRLRAKGHNSEYIAHELGYTPQWIREKLKQFREMSDEEFDRMYYGCDVTVTTGDTKRF